ncbi:MAG: tripartite tricarboxylate transporter permease [Chloroflexota bacterium]|nr:tripartite tricarboxylate transporter permease [Chloroflexota bacterium]
MDALGNLIDGFSVALTPENLLWALVGVFLGTFVGVLPGIGPALTVALLLPVTYALDPIPAFIMFAGIYYGGMYGGSTTSILLNTPGESASIITALEGNQMAKKGRGATALATAAIGSFVAGTIATLGLTFAAPFMADIAIDYFQSPEYLALIVLAFTTVATLLGSSMVRGMVSLFIGLALGLVGIDALTGQPRFTFGNQQLLGGIDVVTVAVGLFAVGETFWVASHMRKETGEVTPVSDSKWMTKEDWKRSWKPWIRGAFFGFPIGSMPAGGAEIPTFLSYSVEKRLSKHPEEFGEGAIEGIAGPEAANNASAAGVLVPLLTLGLPTSATAAILLAAFQRYNLNPGPQLFDDNPELVWGLIASLYIGNLMLLVLNLPLVGMWVKLLSIPRPLLYSGILVFAGLGTWAQSQSVTGLVVLYVIGALGYLMRRFDIPVGPAVVAVILGPMAEVHFRRALQISQGDWTVLFDRPISGTIFAIAALAFIAPAIWRLVQSRNTASTTATA